MVVAVAGTATYLVRKAWWDTDDIPSLQEAISSGKGFEGTDEYDPAEDDHSNLPAKAPPVEVLTAEGEPTTAPTAKIQILRWTAEEREINVTSPRSVRLAFRLLDYPAWRIEVNGQPVTPEFAEGTARIILPLGAGMCRIHMRFARTGDRMAGALLSLAGLIACGALFTKRPSKAGTPTNEGPWSAPSE